MIKPIEPNRKKIQEQAAFCRTLAARLEELVVENVSTDPSYHLWVPNYTQINSDIVRLRRELHKLSDLVRPHYEVL